MSVRKSRRLNWDFGDAAVVGCVDEDSFDGALELPPHADNNKPAAITNNTKTEFVVLLSILILEFKLSLPVW